MRETGERPQNRRLNERIRENWKRYAGERRAKRQYMTRFKYYNRHD